MSWDPVCPFGYTGTSDWQDCKERGQRVKSCTSTKIYAHLILVAVNSPASKSDIASILVAAWLRGNKLGRVDAPTPLKHNTIQVCFSPCLNAVSTSSIANPALVLKARHIILTSIVIDGIRVTSADLLTVRARSL